MGTQLWKGSTRVRSLNLQMVVSYGEKELTRERALSACLFSPEPILYSLSLVLLASITVLDDV